MKKGPTKTNARRLGKTDKYLSYRSFNNKGKLIIQTATKGRGSFPIY